MRKLWSITSLAAAMAVGVAGPAAAQDRSQAQVLEVGEMAPDFALAGSTRYGILRDPVRLSDYRGKTVVLAFFFRARTRG